MIKNLLCLLPLACACCSVQAVPLTWSQTAKLLPDSNSFHYEFGTSVAIDGGIAVAAASRGEYIAYSYNAETGEPLATLLPDTDPGDTARRSIAVHGQTAIVGSLADGVSGNRPGAAYLLDATTGAQLAKLTASDASSGDRFGASVAIGDGIAVVGAPYNGSGAAYVFDTNTGQELAKITSPGSQTIEGFATSVAISGDRLAIGSINEDNHRGAAFLYDLPSGNQLAKLTPEEPRSGLRFGNAVDIDGDTIIVGASSSEAAYLFDATTGDQTHKLEGENSDYTWLFGWSVAVSESHAVVGVLSDYYRDPTAGGGAYVFDVASGEQVAIVSPDDAMRVKRFGSSVDIDAGRMIVGARSDRVGGGSLGSAYLFELVPEPNAACLAVVLAGCCGCRWRP